MRKYVKQIGMMLAFVLAFGVFIANVDTTELKAGGSVYTKLYGDLAKISLQDTKQEVDAVGSRVSAGLSSVSEEQAKKLEEHFKATKSAHKILSERYMQGLMDVEESVYPELEIIPEDFKIDEDIEEEELKELKHELALKIEEVILSSKINEVSIYHYNTEIKRAIENTELDLDEEVKSSLKRTLDFKSQRLESMKTRQYRWEIDRKEKLEYIKDGLASLSGCRNDRESGEYLHVKTNIEKAAEGRFIYSDEETQLLGELEEIMSGCGFDSNSGGSGNGSGGDGSGNGGSDRPGGGSGGSGSGEDKPGIGGEDKPGTGGEDKPSIGGEDKPGTGGEDKPGIGGEDKPGTGGEDKPGTGEDKPGTGGEDKPGTGGEDKPGTGGENKPGNGGEDKPGTGEDKPGTGGEDRPSTGGEDKPGTGGEDKPSTGGEDKPGTGGEDKPSTGGQDKPGTGGEDKPGVGGQDKPGTGGLDKPGAGGSDKPGTGGNSNNGSNVGGNTNNNTNTNNNGSNVGGNPNNNTNNNDSNVGGNTNNGSNVGGNTNNDTNNGSNVGGNVDTDNVDAGGDRGVVDNKIGSPITDGMDDTEYDDFYNLVEGNIESINSDTTKDVLEAIRTSIIRDIRKKSEREKLAEDFNSKLSEYDLTAKTGVQPIGSEDLDKYPTVESNGVLPKSGAGALGVVFLGLVLMYLGKKIRV